MGPFDRSASSRRAILQLVVFVSMTAIFAAAVTPKDFGGKGDVIILRDGTISQGSSEFSSNSANFSTADAGKVIVISGAGEEDFALVTKIQKVVSRQQVTVAANASTSASHAVTYYGTDDTAAIRSCVFEGTAKGGECTISDGVTFLVSNQKSSISPYGAGHNPILKGTINGHGKIIFAPQAPYTPSVNDRLFFITSHETQPMEVAEAIARGAKSFTAKNASDAAGLSPGDWVIFTEKDPAPGVEDNVYTDWAQVSSVDGAVVHTAEPFRMAFPKGRPWGGPPYYWGLSFRKVGPITSNITVRDITIIVPKLLRMPPINHRALVGIDTRDTWGTVITNITCQDASGNCFAGYMDKNLRFENNEIQGAVFSEFSGQADGVVAGNHINQPGSALSLPGPPTSGGLEVDFGTGFSSVTGNVIGPAKQVCIQLSPGVHDTSVQSNACGMVTFGTAANCIFALGGYRLTITENTCAGGTGNSRGIALNDNVRTSAPMYSEGNRVFNNRVQGFASSYACGGRLHADNCGDRR